MAECGCGCSLAANLSLLLSLLHFLWVVNGGPAKSASPLAPALIIFGDSTVDPGNNNGIVTLIKSNFPPYGRDFYGQRPTGRFCNGKIVTDFIVSFLGLKELLPAYLDPHLTTQDLITGVSFASSGTGYDNLTAKIFSVIPLWKQVESFKLYRKQVETAVGPQRASYILSKAVYGISMGNNDFVNNYFAFPIRRKMYSVAQYQDFLVSIARNFLQEIHSLGARKIVVIGLPPLGCLPSVITLNAGGHRQNCIEEYNTASSGFNQKLSDMIQSLQTQWKDAQIAYSDIYQILYNMVQFPARYGFTQTREGCCGTGLLEVAVLCNEAVKKYTCTNASEYVFWDSFHPTQSAYQIIANNLIQQNLRRLL